MKEKRLVWVKTRGNCKQRVRSEVTDRNEMLAQLSLKLDIKKILNLIFIDIHSHSLSSTSRYITKSQRDQLPVGLKA